MDEGTPVLKVFSVAFAILCGAAAISLCGCEDDIRDIMQVGPQTKHEDSTPADDGVVSPVSEDRVSHGATSAGGSLVYKYGGFNGGNAVEDPNTQISNLHITKSKLTYKWAKGSLKNWGLSDTDAGAIACCFFWDGKQWIGAKTDWISTSRTSRDFKNLNGGYNGWKPELYWAAPKRAFCIVSRDGKKRTNLLETEEPK